MTDDLTARCRAALLKACRVTDAIIDADREGVPIEAVCVDVDDAAAAMARAIRAAGRAICESAAVTFDTLTIAKAVESSVEAEALRAARGEDR